MGNRSVISRNYLLANKHSLCDYIRDEGKEIYWQKAKVIHCSYIPSY